MRGRAGITIVGSLLAVMAQGGPHPALEVLLEEEEQTLRNAGGYEELYLQKDTIPESESPETVDSREEEKSLPADEILPRQTTRRRMLEEVDAVWSPPPMEPRAERKEDPGIHRGMRLELEAVFVPEVAFRDIALSEVVRQLTVLSEKWSKDGGAFNFVLLDPEGRNPKVSILLKRLNLLRILDFVVESVGYEYELHSDAVVIRRRKGVGYGLETDFYPLSRSTLIRLTGIRRDFTPESSGLIQDPFELPTEERDERRELEEDLRDFLQRAGILFDGIEGADLAFAEGQLIVTQTARNHTKLRELLQRYRETKQVEIETRFIEVQERNLEELGLEWRLQGGSGHVHNGPGRNLANAFTVGGDESGVVIDRPGFEMPALRSGAPVFPATIDLGANAGNLLELSGTAGELEMSVLVRALERQSGNDLLSAPKVTVLSGKTAEIVVAEEFRYPEFYGDAMAEVGGGNSESGSAGVAITAGTPRDFVTRNIGVEMEVTPTVEEDDSISLRLQPKVTEFEGFVEYGGTSVAIASDTTVTIPSGFYQPVFSVRRLQTEVTIWDGATVVMGGLTREHAVRVNDRIPLLGSIPVLGRLFRSEGTSTQKRNLLIFVTANLVSPGGSPAFQPIPAADSRMTSPVREEEESRLRLAPSGRPPSKVR